MNKVQFDNYLEGKLKATEKLIIQTKQQLNTPVPKLWQVKQMQSYFKNMKSVRAQMEQLEWMLDELYLIPEISKNETSMINLLTHTSMIINDNHPLR